MIELVVWDYNGTLTDDLSRFTKAVNLFLQEQGVPPASEEDVACYDGDIFGFYRRRSIELPMTEIGAGVFGIYATLADHLSLMPGARETLAGIQQPQALISKHPANLLEAEIDLLELRRYFAHIQGGSHEKTEPLQRLCASRGVNPNRCMSIGDRVEDITEAKRAGCVTVAIPGYHPRKLLGQHEPDYLIESLTKIPELL